MDLSNPQVMNILPCSSNDCVNSVLQDGSCQGSSVSSNASSPVYATATSLDDIILEEEPGGVVIDDRSGEDSDGASGTFSCNSSRCSSIRSYERTGIGGSFSSISNRITTQEERC